MWRKCGVACAAGLVAGAAAADPCAGSATESRLLECWQRQYATSEERIRQAEHRLLDAAADEPARTRALQDAQAAWRTFRDAECRWSTFDSASGSAAEGYRLACLAGQNQARAATLRRAAARP
jgi:uncharacterized protein YecT (DUF1311 family)